MTSSPAFEKMQGETKGRGGKRPGSGRKKGVPNKVNAELRALANEYTEEALGVLVAAMRGEGKPEQAKAAEMILDRAHGRPRQATELSGPNGAPIETRDATEFAALASLSPSDRKALQQALEKARDILRRNHDER